MATRLKTRELYFPVLTSITNNTLTNFTTLTVQIPESSVSFVSVVAEFSADDIITVTGGTITTKTLGMRIGAGSYQTFNHAATWTNSGENRSIFFTYDVTSVFTSQWSGTSNTVDVRVQYNQSSGTTTGLRDAFVKLYLTYEFDDESVTQSKTVLIPLGSPTASFALGTSSGCRYVVPNLNTYCPEAFKTFDQICVVVEGNDFTTANSTAHSMSFQLDSSASFSTEARIADLQSMRYYRYAWQPTIDTNATHSLNTWNPSSATTRFGPAAVYMSVDYRYIPASSSAVLNSIQIPMEIDSYSDYAASAEHIYKRGERYIYLPEQNITTRNCGFIAFAHLGTNANFISRAHRSDSFTTYTMVGSGFFCGSISWLQMSPNIVLSSGKNTLTFDVKNVSSTTPSLTNMSGVWLLNYESDITAGNPNKHTHTVKKSIGTMQDGSSAVFHRTITGSYFRVPESDYYFTSIGINYKYGTNTTGTPAGVSVQCSDTGSNGFYWNTVYSDIASEDAETGQRQIFAQCRNIFKRFYQDADSVRLDTSQSRSFRCILASGCTSFDDLMWYVTYHDTTWNVSGSLSGFGTGSIDLAMHRASNGELLKTGSRVGDGDFNFTWYDNTEPVFVIASGSGKVGRSVNQLAE